MKIADILEVYNKAIGESLKNIEEDEPIQNCDVQLFRWKDGRGIEHLIPDGSCVICENCTDVWLDPMFNNRIYYCKCKLGKELEFRSRENCNDKFCSGYKKEEGI